MNTRILQPTSANILRCATRLGSGELVAFPTETVYALGAVATDEAAVKKVYEVKGRQPDKPLIVAVAKKSDISGIAKNVPEKAKMLIDKFMPGALTLVLDKADCVPDAVTAGGSSVAVRIPDNPIALKLIAFTGKPVVVPSANTSDKPSPTLASHVLDDLDGKIEYILDGGASEIGIESTIIDMRIDPPVVLRGGGVTVESIEREIGPIISRTGAERSDGGYMPTADILFSAYYDGMAQNICKRADELSQNGNRVVILCLDGNADKYGERKVYAVGKTYSDYAHNLFAYLRRADAEHIDTVIAEGVESDGIGSSLINRLIKMSGGQII